MYVALFVRTKETFFWQHTGTRRKIRLAGGREGKRDFRKIALYFSLKSDLINIPKENSPVLSG